MLLSWPSLLWFGNGRKQQQLLPNSSPRWRLFGLGKELGNLTCCSLSFLVQSRKGRQQQVLSCLFSKLVSPQFGEGLGVEGGKAARAAGVGIAKSEGLGIGLGEAVLKCGL